MKALIIGCGVGGPAMAMALRKVGIESEIFEAYADSAENIGSFLNIATNGLDALRTLGLHHQVMAAGIPTPRMVMSSGTGKRLGEVPNGLALDDGTVSHTILRADLYRILTDETVSRNIMISYSKRLVSFDDTGSSVTARFEDGTEATGDILIAADGIRSSTRAVLDPTAPAPRYSGLVNFGGLIKDPAFTGRSGDYNMIFGKRAFFGYVVADSGETWWFANLPRAIEPSRKELQDTDWRSILAEAFKDDANFSADLISRSTFDLTLPVHDLPPLPTWHRGRVVLTGDAAHATSPSAGQGASMAIEDAIVLARCLRDEADHRAAFTAFESERRARTERVVAYSRRISNKKAAGPVARVMRDLMMPMFLKKSASSDSLAWMYREHLKL